MLGKYLYCLIFCLFVATVSISQNEKDTKTLSAQAESKLQKENYEEALELYQQLVATNPKNELFNYNLAVCYLNTNINKAKAVPYLEIVSRMENHNPNADFLLGRAYQYANRFDDAIDAFEKFKKNKKGSEDNQRNLDLVITHCMNAKEVMKFPVNVTFQNLGSAINSEFSDYYPFITENEGFVAFNSKRPMDKKVERLENGQYPNSIYISKVINGEFTEADVIGEPICKGNSGEEIIGMNTKGDVLLIYKTDFKGAGKMYMTQVQKNGDFSKLIALPPSVNATGEEIAACINSDASIIYFSSNRKGGFGGTDIYEVRRLPNNKWSEARNLGSVINTAQDEDFPNLSPSGKVLYFSSKGHSSMGGYDIFKTNLNEETQQFENVKNIGYPINTTYDDYNFRISKNGRYGYIASVRGNGKGDMDIYRVVFNEQENDYTVIIGEITVATKTDVIDYKDVFITVNNQATNELVGNYLANPENGRFIVILPPGKYSFQAEAAGFKEKIIQLDIMDKISYQPEINLKVELSK
jgi:stress response protein SCP2